MFVADQLEPTFRILDDRGCLPEDFDSSHTGQFISACVAEVTAGGLPAECAGAPVLGLVFNCLASR